MNATPNLVLLLLLLFSLLLLLLFDNEAIDAKLCPIWMIRLGRLVRTEDGGCRMEDAQVVLKVYCSEVK